MTSMNLDASSAVVLSWLLTYFIHSTILMAVAVAIAIRFADEHAWLDVVWKTALLGPLLTASLQVGSGAIPLGGRWPIDVSMPATGAQIYSRLCRPRRVTETPMDTASMPERNINASVVANIQQRQNPRDSRDLRATWAPAPAHGIVSFVCGQQLPSCPGWRSALVAPGPVRRARSPPLSNRRFGRGSR